MLRRSVLFRSDDPTLSRSRGANEGASCVTVRCVVVLVALTGRIRHIYKALQGGGGDGRLTAAVNTRFELSEAKLQSSQVSLNCQNLPICISE